MTSAAAPLPRFARYEPLFRIAAGGMAEVFAARIRGEGGFEKLVAIKRMLPHLVDDEAFVNMFLDEARLAVHVASPHVVQTLDLGRADDGALFIVMELVIGASLATLAREARRTHQPMPPAVVLELLAQAAQGLDDAHEAVTPTGVGLEIVHRDVSPHNLLIGLDGRARVSDFGIARALLRRTSTGTGELKGKVAYFSPEQADGKPVDRRSDVFALGIVAWECLANRRLFPGSDMIELLAQVRLQPIPPLHEVNPSLPLVVCQAVDRALARPLDERYPTAHAFAVTLREAARELGSTPSPRAIGAWVAATAPEAIGSLRAQLEAAQYDPDGVTIARDPSGSNRAAAPVAATSRTPAASANHRDSTSPTLGSSVVTSAATAAPPAPAAGVRPAMIAAVAGALALAAGAGFLASSRLSSGAAPDASASATREVTSASAPTTAAPVAPSASAPVEVVSARPTAAPVVPRTGRGKSEPPPRPIETGKIIETTRPVETAKPTDRPKGPTGPLLGDDAFK